MRVEDGFLLVSSFHVLPIAVLCTIKNEIVPCFLTNSNIVLIVVYPLTRYGPWFLDDNSRWHYTVIV